VVAMDEDISLGESNLFKQLGEETGVRNIVEIVFELSRDENVQLFKQNISCDTKTLITKFSL